MPIDKSYPVTRRRYDCGYCGRSFESDGSWAWQAASECEAECKEKLAGGYVRVFLPPPGRYDTMFVDRHWRFVERGSPEHVCANEGHDEERFWERDLCARVVEQEREVVRCRRCRREVYEFGGRTRPVERENNDGHDVETS